MSGGGATVETITRKVLDVLPALSLGEDLWLCSPLFCSCAYLPHSLLSCEGQNEIAGRCFCFFLFFFPASTSRGDNDSRF